MESSSLESCLVYTFFATKVLERVGVRFTYGCACDWRWGGMVMFFALVRYELDRIV